MIGIIGLIFSIILNVILIWDKIKPFKSILICKLNKHLSNNYGEILSITNNLSNKTVKIIEINLDVNKISNFENRKFPIILQPKNNIDFLIITTKHDEYSRPSHCEIKYSTKKKVKSLEFSL